MPCLIILFPPPEGVKVGGTTAQRLDRLWAVRGLAAAAIPARLRPKVSANNSQGPPAKQPRLSAAGRGRGREMTLPAWATAVGGAGAAGRGGGGGRGGDTYQGDHRRGQS